MAETRTVKVVVTAAAEQYLSTMRNVGTAATSAAGKAEQAFAKQKTSLDQVGKAAAVASGLFTVAFVAMVKASADFEQRMSQVQALSKATAGQMGQLRDAAFTAGKAFGLSATQVADAQIELTKAGVSVKDIIGGALPGALALAAAGQIDVAKATEIASNAMTEFKLKGSDVPHLADLLAAGADKSVASVQSLGDALNQSGLVAAQFGLSAEDTIGTLTAFSKAGLNGSDAGTSFKTMLTQLASPTKQAQSALEKYNITTYDSQGKFVGITNLAQQLHDKLGGLPSVYGKVSQAQRNNALSTIFGNDAIRASSALYDLGGKKLQGFIDGNNEAGFAALQASKKLDNLNGDLQKLSASFQNDLIKSGSAGNDVLRGLAGGATNLLTVFGDLPKPIQGTALVIAGVGAAVTAAGAAFLLLVPKIGAAKAAMTDLGISGKGVAAGFGKGGGILLGITAITSGLANLASQGETTSTQLNLAAKSAKDGYGNIDSLFKGNAFGGAKGAAEALKRSFSGNFFENDSAGTKFIDGLTFGITKFSDTYKSNEGQFKALGEQLAALSRTDYSGATQSFNDLVKKMGGGNDAAREALQAFPAYREEIVKLLNESGKAATEQNVLAAAAGRGGVASALQSAQNAANKSANALQKMSGSAVSAGVDIGALSKTIAGFGGATLDARGAQRAFAAAVDDASAAAKKNGHNLNINTAAGRENQAALDGIAGAAANAASKILEQSGSTTKAAGAISKGRSAFIRAAEAMGMSANEAKRLADNEGLIPGNVKTAVHATGFDSAIAKAAALRDYLNSLHSRALTINVTKTGNGATFSDSRDTAISRASGGPITGPGPKGKDSVLAYLAPGEHVLTAKEVDKMGGQAAVYAFRKGIQAYATGGAIGDANRNAGIEETSRKNLNRLIAAAKRTAAADQKTADHLASVYSDMDGSKKNRSAKLAAKHRADNAKKKADKAAKYVEELQKQHDEAVSQRNDFQASAKTLGQNSEDFVSTQRRATADNPIDPMSYIDQLRSMSRDDNYSKTRQKSYQNAANQYEKSLVTLADKSAKAAKTLGDLQSSADSMRSGITSAIAGRYNTGGIGMDTGTTSSSVMRNGIQFTTSGTTSGTSADAIDAYYSKGASSTAQFANQLQQLANRGVNGALLAEIAQDQNGPQLAAALLTASSGQISSINSNYQAIQGNAATAAGTVTDYNFKNLIDAAQKNADNITAQIAADGEKLRKLIASAFGLKGYAAGTDNALPGWHLVGEKGPELANFGRGGGAVKTNRWLTSAMAANGGSAGNVTVISKIPETITVQDTAGFMYTMRTVAQQVVAQDAHLDSVLTYGGAA